MTIGNKGWRWGQGSGKVGQGWKACGLALMLAACSGNEVPSGEEPPPAAPEVPSGGSPTTPEPPAAAEPKPRPPENTTPEVTPPWPRHYGGKGVEQLQALASDSAGGFVAGGFFGSVPFPQGTGFALARYSSTGDPVWVRQITTEEVQLSALTVTPEGNILAVGNYRGAPNLGTGTLSPVNSPYGGRGLFVAKFSPNGTLVWSQGFVPTYFDEHYQELVYTNIFAESVATDANGSLIVVGNFFGEVNFGTGMISAGPASTATQDSYPGGFVAKFTWQGTPVWSRAFEACADKPADFVRTVTTDGDSNILVGGRVGDGANLGDGPLPYSSAFIAKYTPGGALLWKRMFRGADGEVTGLRTLSSGHVVFTANLGDRFSFGGQVYTGGGPEGMSFPNTSGYVGVLSAQGADRWIRDRGGLVKLTGLVTGSSGLITFTGFRRVPSDEPHEIFRYDASGTFLWMQALSQHLGIQEDTSRLFLVPLPGDAVVAGADLHQSVQYKGTVYTSRGESDLFFFQAGP
jgi:hypothetical protein